MPAIKPIDRRAPRVDERARRGNRNQAGEHAVAQHRRIGLEPLGLERHHRSDRRRDTGQHGVHDDVADAEIGTRQCRSRIEAEPTERQDKRPEDDHRNVVARNRLRLAVHVLADAGTDHHRSCEGDHCLPSHGRRLTRQNRPHRDRAPS